MRPEAKVLLMSGYAQDLLAPGDTDIGASFIAKPFSPEALAQKVREVLDEMSPAGRA